MIIDVPAMMADTEAKATLEKIKDTMKNDAVVAKMVEAAQTVEDAYQVVTRYVSMKFEDFKEICNDMLDYFKGPKVALDDDIMEAVVGGGFWGNLWNKCKDVVMAAAIGVGAGILASCAVLAVAPVAASTAVAAGVVGVAGAVAAGIGVYKLWQAQAESAQKVNTQNA